MNRTCVYTAELQTDYDLFEFIEMKMILIFQIWLFEFKPVYTHHKITA